MAAGKKVSMTWSFLKASLPGKHNMTLCRLSLIFFFYILFVLYSVLIFLFEV